TRFDSRPRFPEEFFMVRHLIGTVLALVSAGVLMAPAEDKRADGKSLFNGKDLTGWKLRHPASDKRASKWSVVSTVKLKEGMLNQLAGDRGEGILLNGDDGRGIDFLSEEPHGDCQLHIEFVVPKGSNSGVYFQGQYEVQILDSYGKKDAELKYGD